MATIKPFGNGYEAEYNRSTWRILQTQDGQKVYRLVDGQATPAPHSHEVAGLLLFVGWHKRTGESDLPVLFALADGQKESDP